MSSRIIEWSLSNRGIVLLLTLVLAVAGVWAAGEIKLDAIPDLSDVQVIVQTDFMGQAPLIIEEQVTYPITRAMLQVPYAKVVRGYSAFGASYVYVLFEEGTDLYWARSRVLESLSTITDRMPKGVTPKLGPPATGVGWVYQYALVDETGQHDLAELRSLQDWFLRYELLSVEGVSDVASLGGFVKSYQIEMDPYKLAAYGLSLNMLKTALERSNNEAGGRVIEQAETEFMVRVTGYLKSREDILGIPLKVDKQGASVQIRNVAKVTVGPDWRPGILEWNGEGEAVGGIVIMRHGENALTTIRAVKQRLEALKRNLPSGVRILPGYDRSSLIDRAIETLKDKLVEELIVVALVCVLFLLHARSAFVSVVTLPIGILASLLIMNFLGISANIMSLSGIAIAIGAMVDAAVVMVENAHKHLERDQGRSHLEVILNSAKEVGPALFTSLLIITVSFLPVFALSEQSGRLFKPLAFTKTFAMASSAFLSITLIPVLMFYFIRGHIRPEKDNPLNRFLLTLYTPVARFVLKYKVIAILGCVDTEKCAWRRQMSTRRRKEWKSESRYPRDGPDMPNPARGGIEAIHGAKPGWIGSPEPKYTRQEGALGKWVGRVMNRNQPVTYPALISDEGSGSRHFGGRPSRHPSFLRKSKSFPHHARHRGRTCFPFDVERAWAQRQLEASKGRNK